MFLYKNNWKKELFQFLEIANGRVKFPVLFSIKPEEVLGTIGLIQSSVRELLQVFAQNASNAYLYRFCMYVLDKELKKNYRQNS